MAAVTYIPAMLARSQVNGSVVVDFDTDTFICLGAWSWLGGEPTINAKTLLTAAQATWAWFGNAVTSFPVEGAGGSGMVQGLVRGLARIIVRGTNVGKP